MISLLGPAEIVLVPLNFARYEVYVAFEVNVLLPFTILLEVSFICAPLIEVMYPVTVAVVVEVEVANPDGNTNAELVGE